MKTFDPIRPAPTRDLFMFDLTQEIQANPPLGAPSTPVIASVAWSIALDPGSEILDPTPTARLIGPEVYDEYKTANLVGDMIDGATYVLTAQVTVSDGRILVTEGQVACLEERQPVVATDPSAVPFDYNGFVSAYPEFKGISAEVGARLWSEAGLLFRNDGTSPEPDLNLRRIILGAATAHLATLYGGPGGGGWSGLVGQVNSKSVNGVSISSEGFGVTGTQAYFLTTRYGAEFWRLTAAYRTFHYLPGPTRFPTTVGRWPYSLTR